MSPHATARPAPVIALLTDFGTADHYVAAMKGVILNRVPSARIIDITHAIEPGHVRSAGFALWAVHEALPERTVSAVVVDPGVGTDRGILCAVADRRTYLAPDNGVLDILLARCGSAKLVRVDMRKVRRMLPEQISSTFHGRDIFAPLAGRLASGTRPSALGASVAFRRPGEWRSLGPGEGAAPAILSIDRFGNIITNIVAPEITAVQRTIRAISVGKVMISVAASTFGTAPENTPCIVAGSSGLAEIVVRNGSAAGVLRVTDRSPIRVVWVDEGQEA